MMNRAQVSVTSSAGGRPKVSYHLIALAAGLLVFCCQVFVLNSKHSEHVRQMQAVNPLIPEPCPVSSTERGAVSERKVEEESSLERSPESNGPDKLLEHPNAKPRHDYKSDKKLRNDSSDASVFAMAQGYTLDTHRRFVGSLRKSGFTGTIMLATEPELKPGVEEYLLSKDVTILRLNYTECVHKILEDHEVKNKKDKECNTCIAPYQNVKVCFC